MPLRAELSSVEFWIHAAPLPSAEELNFLREQFAIQPGEKVLDIPCGAGRHAVPLAELGYAVTGFDISAQFLSQARQFAQEREVSVDWQLGDMRTLACKEEFDACIRRPNHFSRVDDSAGTRHVTCAGSDQVAFAT